MRSNKAGATASHIGAVAGSICQQTARSIDSTPTSPQLCAMSVALLDQGERVPARGATKRAPGGTIQGVVSAFSIAASFVTESVVSESSVHTT